MPPTPATCEDIFGGARLVGAFDSTRRVVVLNPALGDAATTQAEWTRTLTHELVHAYDHCRVQLDPLDCRHIACTEVRAANLSGDCDFSVDLMRGGLTAAAPLQLAGHQQRCVRRRAELSLRAHPQCVGAGDPPRAFRDTVDDVWDACYRDTEPFSGN